MAPATPEDRLFLERLLCSDDDAWAALQRALEHLVRNRGLRFRFTDEEIEDLQSRIQHKLLEKDCLRLRTFDLRCRLIEWVGVLVLNEARDYYKAKGREWRREERERALAEVRSEMPAHERLLETLSASQSVQAALATLTAENRMILTLRFVQGFTHPQIAQLTGLSIRAVHSRVYRALEQMSAALGGPPVEEPAPEAETEADEPELRVIRREA